MIKVNDSITLPIEDLTATGEGVGHINDLTVFIEETIPGDLIEAKITTLKKNYAIGQCIRRLEDSPKRTEPVCSYAKQCGGCQLQQMKAADQALFKKHLVVSALQRIGGIHDAVVRPVLTMTTPFRYRNKAQYKISEKGTGFYAKRSHEVIPITDCLTQPESCQQVIQTINRVVSSKLLTVYNEQTHTGVLRGLVQRTNLKGENMLILVINSPTLPNEKEIVHLFCENVPQVRSLYVNINRKKGNTVLGKENRLLYGDQQLEETISNCHYLISPNSFFQVNSIQTKVLYDTVKRMADLQGKETVFDLYCGTGTIGLYLADNAEKIYGIEIVPDAVKDARKNAALNQIKQAEFITGKAEIEAQKLVKQGIKPDLVILDPPRKGCDQSLLEMIKQLKTPRVVYVSCNPATLARDLKILIQEDYSISEIQPVDLFPGTGHVETVVLLQRKTS